MAGQFFGRCCSYPQGHLSVFPQILSLIATIVALTALPWPGWLYEDTDQTGHVFMYLEHYSFSKVTVYDDQGYSNTVYTGSPIRPFYLRLSDPAYWEGSNDAGWYWKIQLGAFFGIMAVVVGFIALAVLFTACCFPLEVRTIRKIALAHATASVLSLLTLTALATDLDEDYLEKHGGPALISMIFASFFFAWASFFNFRYAKLVEDGNLPRDADEDEKTHLVEHHHQTSDDTPTNEGEDNA